MCLHGFSWSGHVQSASSWPHVAGSNCVWAAPNTASSSAGTSPASNCAANPTRERIASSILRHCDALGVLA